MKRIYISGPMTGYPGHNYEAFHEAEATWKANGWLVLNPARNFGGRTDLPREVYMSQDVLLVHGSDAVGVLPGFEESQGAKLEVAIAKELGHKLFDAVTGEYLDVDVDITVRRR